MLFRSGKATVQEAIDLSGDHLYNPTWGWQDGKKRSDNIRENFDPTLMFNYIYKNEKTTVNTGAAVRWVHYARTRLSYYNGNDTRPDYYKNLPSYWTMLGNDNPEMAAYYTDLWENDENFRQLNWDSFYEANYLNNWQNQSLPEAQKKGSTYIQQMEHSNQVNFIVGSTINHLGAAVGVVEIVLHDVGRSVGGIELTPCETVDIGPELAAEQIGRAHG